MDWQWGGHQPSANASRLRSTGSKRGTPDAGGPGANNEHNFLASHCCVARALPREQRGWRREAERARNLGTNSHPRAVRGRRQVWRHRSHGNQELKQRPAAPDSALDLRGCLAWVRLRTLATVCGGAQTPSSSPGRVRESGAQCGECGKQRSIHRQPCFSPLSLPLPPLAFLCPARFSSLCEGRCWLLILLQTKDEGALPLQRASGSPFKEKLWVWVVGLLRSLRPAEPSPLSGKRIPQLENSSLAHKPVPVAQSKSLGFPVFPSPTSKMGEKQWS